MDFLTVSTSAYLGATLMSLLLTIALVVQEQYHPWKRPLALGAAIQTFWLIVLSSSYFSGDVSSRTLLALEALHFFGWITAFGLALWRCRLDPARVRGFRFLFIFGLVMTALTLTLVLSNSSTNAHLVSLCYVVLAATSLVSLEQVARNLPLSRFLKLTGACLAILFIFDIFLYSQAFVEGQLDPMLWQSRAAIIMAGCFSIAAGSLVSSNSNQSITYLSVSRPVAFYSASIVLSGLLIALVGVGGYYVKIANGYWGSYLYSLLIFFGFLVLAALFVSQSFRQSVEVFISKHFFHHKYDYRQQWLDIIRQLSQPVPEERYHAHAFGVLASVFQNTTGSLWRVEGHYLLPVHHGGERDSLPPRLDRDSEFARTLAGEEWVFSPRSTRPSLARYNHLLPEPLASNPAIWLIVPLVSQSHLVGMAILNQPAHPHEPSWEDLDLLKTIGRQLAGHLQLNDQARALREAEQFDTYNKLTAFIMHDMNNVIAQLDLMGRNAQRHKSNPAFIDDMIATVHNSVGKMRQLVQRFARADASQARDFSLFTALEAVLDACTARQPAPVFDWLAEDTGIHADRERFVQTLEHLVSNAQDATADDGGVFIRVSGSPSQGIKIEIEDEGEGMTGDFIENHLFRPFDTTREGQGMGIGAYLSRSYIRQLGGDLQVSSEPGRGTRVSIHLDPRVCHTDRPRTDRQQGATA